MPLLREKWAEECQPRALFHQGQKPFKREWTLLGLEDTYLGNAGFPGLSASFSNGASRDLEELNTNKMGRDHEADAWGVWGTSAPRPAASAAAFWPRLSSSAPSLLLGVGVRALLQLACIPLVTNGTPDAK